MTQNPHPNRFLYEGLITALAIGGIFIVLGLAIVSTPNIVQISTAFFKDLSNATYPIGTGNAVLPAPANPAAHAAFYTAIINFMLGVGILQIVILALRVGLHSRVRRIGETVGNMVFWLGAAAVANVFLLAGTLQGWFQFWAFLIVIVGLSLIIRFAIHFVHWSTRPKTPNP